MRLDHAVREPRYLLLLMLVISVLSIKKPLVCVQDGAFLFDTVLFYLTCKLLLLFGHISFDGEDFVCCTEERAYVLFRHGLQNKSLI